MHLVYDGLLLVASIVLLPWALVKLVVDRGWRKGARERLALYPAEVRNALLAAAPPVWFHAVSVGEVTALVPLVRRLKEVRPDLAVVVSTVTVTGNATARARLPFADRVLFFPLDLGWVVRRAVALVRPRLFISTESEIWPNMLREVARRGIPAMIVNGRISATSAARYRFFGFFMRAIFERVSLFCMQEGRYAERIERMGVDRGRVLVTGSLKYDQPIRDLAAGEREELRASLGFAPGGLVLVAGSTHREEERIVAGAFRRVRERIPAAGLVLAPRHPDRFDEAFAIVRAAGLEVERRSSGPASGRTPVVLLDSIGELAQIYGAADVAIVCGSFVPVGGHNVLEPAAHGVPVVFGPMMENFAEAARGLVAAGGGVQVSDEAALVEACVRLLADPAARREMGGRARDLVEKGKGATEKSLEAILRVVGSGGGEVASPVGGAPAGGEA